jgi:hypothetical protein
MTIDRTQLEKAAESAYWQEKLKTMTTDELVARFSELASKRLGLPEGTLLTHQQVFMIGYEEFPHLRERISKHLM